MHTHRLARSLLASVSALALSSAFALSTFTAPAVAQAAGAVANAGTVVGAPTITPSSPLGYYIWRDDERVHVATHGPGDEHHFVARLYTEGTFENIDTSHLEQGDTYKLLDGGHMLVLDFYTYQATDDIAFTVRGADGMRLDLNLDGSPIDTGLIYLGPTGRHPATNPFHIDL